MADPKITFVDTMVVESGRGDLNKTGLKLTNETREFSGTPGLRGIVKLPVRATNNYGSDEEIVTLNIRGPQAPEIADFSLKAYMTEAVNFRLSGRYITVGESKFITYVKWTATGLPSGCSIDEDTGYITGTPRQTGTFYTTVTCENDGGMGIATITWNISAEKPKPIISYGSIDLDMECPANPGFSGTHDHPKIVLAPGDTTSASCNPNKTWISLNGGRKIRFWVETLALKTVSGVKKRQLKVHGEITGGNKKQSGQSIQYGTAYMKIMCTASEAIYAIDCSYQYKYYA